MLSGLEWRQPWNLLLASKMTDIKELPKLLKRSDLNRLWLMKMASNGLSKSSFGTVPSNSLNLKSWNLRCESFKTTPYRFLEQPFHHFWPSRVDPEVQNDDESAVNQYLANLSTISGLSYNKPLWEIHLLLAHKCAIFRAHHTTRWEMGSH